MVRPYPKNNIFRFRHEDLRCNGKLVLHRMGDDHITVLYIPIRPTRRTVIKGPAGRILAEPVIDRRCGIRFDDTARVVERRAAAQARLSSSVIQPGAARTKCGMR